MMIKCVSNGFDRKEKKTQTGDERGSGTKIKSQTSIAESKSLRKHSKQKIKISILGKRKTYASRNPMITKMY